MRTKVLIDTDPGVDDTMAILFALRSSELEVLGLSTVFGNTEVVYTAQNGLRLVELEGHGHIPVAQGAARPLLNGLRHTGQQVHGVDGMGGTNPPPPRGQLQAMTGAELIIETVRTHPGEVTLVPVGPLTNIALALRLEPRLPELVKEVVIMGGASYVPGNASPVGEANIFNDPHAASIVFNAGWKLTMVGLDVTMKTIMTPAYLDSLRRPGNRATELILNILPHYQAFHHQTYGMDGAIHTHDPSAFAYIINPALYQCEMMPVFVETEGRCAGQTVPDRRHQWEGVPMINVCLGVDSDGVLELYKQRLTSA
jgi:uridine nucleosidase